MCFLLALHLISLFFVALRIIFACIISFYAASFFVVVGFMLLYSYFNTQGLAEPIRYLLSYGGVKWEDFRFPMTIGADGSYIQDEWKEAVKSGKYTWDKMPVLEVDGKMIAQSRAIERHLAQKFGLYGENEIDQLEIDSVTEQINDLRYDITCSIMII